MIIAPTMAISSSYFKREQPGLRGTIQIGSNVMHGSQMGHSRNRGRCLRRQIHQRSRQQQSHDKSHAQSGSEFGFQRSTLAQGLWRSQVEQHDDEQEQHHDRPGVHDNLHGGDKLRGKRDVENRYADKCRDQIQCAAHRVHADNHHNGGSDGDHRQSQKQQATGLNKRSYEIRNHGIVYPQTINKNYSGLACRIAGVIVRHRI